MSDETTIPASGSAAPATVRQWWPEQLDLTMLHRGPVPGDPMAPDFDYAAEFATLDLEAVRRDLFALMTDSQEWWPADGARVARPVTALGPTSAGYDDLQETLGFVGPRDAGGRRDSPVDRALRGMTDDLRAAPPRILAVHDPLAADSVDRAAPPTPCSSGSKTSARRWRRRRRPPTARRSSAPAWASTWSCWTGTSAASPGRPRRSSPKAGSSSATRDRPRPGPLVPTEPPIWRIPVPAVTHPLVGPREVAILKQKVLDSGLTVTQLVSTAWLRPRPSARRTSAAEPMGPDSAWSRSAAGRSMSPRRWLRRWTHWGRSAGLQRTGRGRRADLPRRPDRAGRLRRGREGCAGRRLRRRGALRARAHRRGAGDDRRRVVRRARAGRRRVPQLPRRRRACGCLLGSPPVWRGVSPRGSAPSTAPSLAPSLAPAMAQTPSAHLPRRRRSLVSVRSGEPRGRQTPAASICSASTAPCTQQPTAWSLTMPAACISE